jgi:hypothetical protein
MNIVIEFFRILFLIPISGQAEERFLAADNEDFDDSVISASRMFRGRNRDIAFLPAPRTMKLLRP